MFYGKRDVRVHLRRVQFNAKAKELGIPVQELSEFHGYTDGKVHPCADCDRSFPSSTHLKRHQLYAHLKTLNHSCRECGKRFVTKGDVDRHVKNVHLNIRDHVCSGKCSVIHKDSWSWLSSSFLTFMERKRLGVTSETPIAFTLIWIFHFLVQMACHF